MCFDIAKDFQRFMLQKFSQFAFAQNTFRSCIIIIVHKLYNIASILDTNGSLENVWKIRLFWWETQCPSMKGACFSFNYMIVPWKIDAPSTQKLISLEAKLV
jgi:hypothetical protein